MYRVVYVIRGMWGFFTTISQYAWQAFVWSLSKDRWQVSIGILFLVLAAVFVGIPITLYSKTLNPIEVWKLITLVSVVLTCLSIAMLCLYSYTIDRSKVDWLDTREKEAEREFKRAELAFNLAAKQATGALVDRVQIFKPDHVGGLFGNVIQPQALPEPADNPDLSIQLETDELSENLELPSLDDL